MPPVIYMSRHRDLKGRYLVVWQQSEFINNLNSLMNIDEKLTNKIVAVLTSGSCTNYSSCYRPIEKYTEFIGNRNLVFGISYKSTFNFTNVHSRIFKNNWNFISDGGFWKKDAKLLDANNLFKFYGIMFDREKRSGFSLANENICKDL